MKIIFEDKNGSDSVFFSHISWMVLKTVNKEDKFDMAIALVLYKMHMVVASEFIGANYQQREPHYDFQFDVEKMYDEYYTKSKEELSKLIDKELSP